MLNILEPNPTIMGLNAGGATPVRAASSLHGALQELSSELAARVSPACSVKTSEPLAKRTTLRVGGPADIFVEPSTEGDLSQALAFIQEHHLAFFILGRGSNLIVRDGGFRGVVICLGHANFSQTELDGTRIRCGAGAKLKLISVEAKRAGIAGLEFLEGIPGSLGGALRMNAGAMGRSTFDVVETLRYMDYFGAIHECAGPEAKPVYRSCPLLLNHIALGAVLSGKSDHPGLIEVRMGEYSRKRWDSQPAAPSAGCMFKNPQEMSSGKIIDEMGLKGMKVGGAMVSLEHGNFIINDGRATAKDVLALAELVRQRVYESRGIDLHLEVEVIGEDLPNG